MRIVTALLLVFLAPAALAQPCDPAATDEVCPDTTDWRRYFPLEVGNQWQYENSRFTGEPVTFSSWTITGETEVGGQPYFELERCDEAADGSATCGEPILIRYDDEHELITRRTDDGETWWDVLPCDLGAAFNTGTYFDEPQECTGLAAGFVLDGVEGAYEAIVAVPPDEVNGDTRKSYEMYPGTGPEMYAGLGVTKYFFDLQAEPMRLVYANVGGEQVGTPAFASCDPSDPGGVVCPDTTDWRRYFPLAVGNRWQYEREGPCDLDQICRWGREIVSSEVVDGKGFFFVRQCREEGSGDITCYGSIPVRYDDDVRAVVSENEDGTLEDYLYVCNLAFPFGFYGEADCGTEDDPGWKWEASGGYGAVFDLGEGPSLEDSGKSISNIGAGITFFAGIGPTYWIGDAEEFGDALVYARIDGDEFGMPAFVFPTSGEPGTAQPVATAFTGVFPNPASEVATAEYVLNHPQAVMLELIDLLGRRVRSAELGSQPAGAHDIQLDLGGLRPGLYVLRLRGDAGAEATRRIVVVR